MKRISFILIAALMLSMTFISCKKDEQASPEPTPTQDEINYLVMYYAVGGNLDDGQMANILQALDYGSTDKVRMTFEYKLSKSFQVDSNSTFENFDGTRRFTTDQNPDFKDKIKGAHKSGLNVDEIEDMCNNLKSIRLGDASYMMSSDTALKSFINWSKDLYPNAKNLILILGDHGGGWNLKDDGVNDCTKSILHDDNGKFPMLTAKGVERAISESKVKRVKMIYTDACLMAVHENFQTYSRVTDYAMSAVEYTPGRGGNYYEMLKLLDGDKSLWDACKSYIDYLNTTWWNGLKFCDLGIYDLGKNSALTAVCKSISETLVSCWNNKAEITPGKESSLWKEYIRVAVTGCELSADGYLISASDVPTKIVPFLEEAKIKPTDGDYKTNDILDWLLGDSESVNKAKEQYPEDFIELQKVVEYDSHQEYCLADFLKVLNSALKDGGLADAKNPFIKLRTDYISALKDMSYINCTDKTSETDYAYGHCGPGIFLYSFDSITWGAHSTDEWFIFGKMKVEDAISYYQASDFDKATQWSSFLKLNDVAPSLITNPTRRTNQKKIESLKRDCNGETGRGIGVQEFASVRGFVPLN